MQLALNADERAIQDMARQFAREQIAPHAAAWDVAGAFPRSLLADMAKNELLGIPFPERHGGAGLSYMAYILVLEAISAADAGVGVTLAVHSSAATYPIYRYGTDDQKARYLSLLASGQGIGAFALTEPNSGSDASALTTSARQDGDVWVLNGSKQWITNGDFASLFIVFARTSPGTTGAKGVSCFIVERDTAGLSVMPGWKKMGLHSSCTNDLVFENVRVPAANLLGEQDNGFKISMDTLDGGRIGIAAQACGIAQAALDASVKYVQERTAFGKPISDFQAIQWKLADMATQLDAARLLTYKAAWLKDQDQPHSQAGAMAKLMASRVAREVTNEAVQVFGGYGYMSEFPVERYYRDAKITEIYEGTSEIQRIVIARQLLKQP
jgi:alkylation response protein AidB-like acyl-CoA dehydrogenase